MKFSMKSAWKDVTRHTGKAMLVMYYCMTALTMVCGYLSMYCPTTIRNWRLLRFYTNVFTYVTTVLVILDLVMILALIAAKNEE